MNYDTQKGQGSSVRMRPTLVHCSTGQELQRKVSLNKLCLLVSVNSVCAGAVESKCTASLGMRHDVQLGNILLIAHFT